MIHHPKTWVILVTAMTGCGGDDETGIVNGDNQRFSDEEVLDVPEDVGSNNDAAKADVPFIVPENCENKECGNNGKGLSCGECKLDSICGPFNQCVNCIPDCEGTRGQGFCSCLWVGILPSIHLYQCSNASFRLLDAETCWMYDWVSEQ